MFKFFIGFMLGLSFGLMLGSPVHAQHKMESGFIVGCDTQEQAEALAVEVEGESIAGLVAALKTINARFGLAACTAGTVDFIPDAKVSTVQTPKHPGWHTEIISAVIVLSRGDGPAILEQFLVLPVKETDA